MLEKIVVFMIVATAVAYFARHLWKLFKNTGDVGGCGGCRCSSSCNSDESCQQALEIKGK
ncbi:FeoB-associated Cys-rich membrane protein [Desulfococcaceae bacterium HSG8]|nr:FeoB-associated Cys-rich membrane protein [Desulfococcaceae bacterium HSG8]